LIHHTGTWHVGSHEAHPHVELFVLHFTLCFVKALRWWGVTRFAQPHIHIQPHVNVVQARDSTWAGTNGHFGVSAQDKMI
jgi:hypothetical protein